MAHRLTSLDAKAHPGFLARRILSLLPVKDLSACTQASSGLGRAAAIAARSALKWVYQGYFSTPTAHDRLRHWHAQIANERREDFARPATEALHVLATATDRFARRTETARRRAAVGLSSVFACEAEAVRHASLPPHDAAELERLKSFFLALFFSEEWEEPASVIASLQNVNMALHADGWTPLHRAADKGFVDSAKLLIEAGADVNLADSYGRTPAYIASQHGHTEALKLLTEAGAYMFMNGS